VQADANAFGEKALEAPCRATISPHPEAEATAEVWTLGLAVKPNAGNTVFLPYTDAGNIDASNFRVNITTSNGSILLSRLGSSYDQFALELGNRHSDAIAKALLMEEPNKLYEASCSYSAVTGGSTTSGQCRARIYETALVILPVNAKPRRIPLTFITSVDLQGYKVVVTSEYGIVELSRLGNATSFFSDKLREAVRSLEAATLETIKSMIPSAGYNELRGLSRPMAEGRAAPRKSVEMISPDLWKRLELSVSQSQLAETYQHLSTIGESGLSSIGLRKAMEGVYVWVLVPVMGSVQGGGNAIVMEVTSEGGHASYLFWVVPRAEFQNITKDSWSREAENVTRALNEAVIATGFRREPIYLSEDQLNTPEYGKYLYAAANLDSLRFLRERFFARVIHVDFDQWKEDLQDALLFNTTAGEAVARWGKSKLDFVESPSVARPTQTPAVPVSAAPAPAISPTNQALNAEAATTGTVSDRVYTLRNMEADDQGNVKLWLHDSELDHDTAIKITSQQAAELGAFPGAKVKVSLQKA